MSNSYHDIQSTHLYVTVVLPLALAQSYTYYVPEEFVDKVIKGVRVEVQFGRNKYYTGIVKELLHKIPDGVKPKPIQSVMDKMPIVTDQQFILWQWMSTYYHCTMGEVMNAALPAHLKLSSETVLSMSPLFDGNYDGLSNDEYLITEALSFNDELTVKDVRDIIEKKTIYHIIKSLIEKKIILLKEDMKQKYQPKKIMCIRLQEPFASEPQRLTEAFELTTKSDRQTRALMAFIQLDKQHDFVRKSDVYKKSNTDTSVINALIKKGIFIDYEKKISRIAGFEDEVVGAGELSPRQVEVISELKSCFEEKSVALLHGVTGSGKTRVYIELIQEVIDKGGQVLYLLPEIALTTQLIRRLQQVFGDKIAVYHSRMNNNERVELWMAAMRNKPIIMGPRSAMLLPFQNLELVVVDEEHDPSFKQRDPAPRYNGRDTAIYLAHIFKAKTILGTATPSLESYYNAKKGKYGLIHLMERFGGVQLPEVVIVDAKRELKEKKLQSHFTSVLLEELKATLERGEQAILFQNRRGYSPTYRCLDCDWHSECINCDVSLTYHKFHNKLKCHYCGYQSNLPDKCPGCGGSNLNLLGFGTEKIEDELKIFFPDASIARMDLETARSKKSLNKIIHDFEEGRVNILVGTQMVTKGLDFDNVGLVGVLSADQLLQFPDFRATERAFQLMVQVSGRAGRKQKQGKVLIQAYNTDHPVLKEVIGNNYKDFFEREIAERHDFHYPPFQKLIKVTLRHKKPVTVNDGMRIYAQYLKSKLGGWVIGPAVPYVARVRGFYIIDLLVKIDNNPKKLSFAKKHIQAATELLSKEKGYSSVRVTVDVDPV